jgi:hypothetical protein
VRPILLTETARWMAAGYRELPTWPVMVNPEGIAFMRGCGEGTYVSLLSGAHLFVTETPAAVCNLLRTCREALRVEERDGVGASA